MKIFIKENLIKRFEEIAEVKNEEVKKAGLTCICGNCNLATFSLKEIKEAIGDFND